MNARSLFGVALWLAALGHLIVAAAASQVPRVLRWNEELPRLGSFNRKIFRVYGNYILMVIAALGAFTAVFREEMLRGERTALAVALFIGVFWLGRIVVDFFYYSHDDWPRGRVFVVGHVLLTALFICMSGTYFALVAWHAGWL